MLLNTLEILINHPLSLNRKVKVIQRYLSWQISSNIGNTEQIKPWIGGLKIIVKRGYHASTACHYLGLPEFESMGFTLHFLRPGDIFFDVGANIGSYSFLASGICGAKTVAFEPAPNATTIFRKNIILNNLEKEITLHEIALGTSLQSTVQLTTGKGIQNHVVISNCSNGIAVNSSTLDNYTVSTRPLLIKMDVEGYETAVVSGAVNTLQSADVKAIIIEKMGLGQRYGFDEDKLHQELLSMGFELFDYQPLSRKLARLSAPILGNNLYLRVPDFAEERLMTAQKLMIYGNSF